MDHFENEGNKLTLRLLRMVRMRLLVKYGEECSRDLIVKYHPMLEPDIRDLPNFTPAELYNPCFSAHTIEDEIGRTERFIFVVDNSLSSPNPELFRMVIADKATLYCKPYTLD